MRLWINKYIQPKLTNHNDEIIKILFTHNQGPVDTIVTPDNF